MLISESPIKPKKMIYYAYQPWALLDRRAQSEELVADFYDEEVNFSRSTIDYDG